jgi:hypothetical protein
MRRIKKGNSFPVVLYLRDADDVVVNPVEIDGLVIVLTPHNRPDIPVSYEIAENELIVRVTTDMAPFLCKYRLAIKGVYRGENIDRNPLVFEIVSNVEDENQSGGCAEIEVNPVIIKTNFVVGGNPVPVDVVWGGITGEIDDQTDLIDRFNQIEENVEGAVLVQVIDEVNNLGFQTKSQVADAVTSGVSNHDSDAEAHKKLLANYVEKANLPSLDGYATENYVDDEIAKLESSALTFKGFISPAQPAGDVRDGNYWIRSSELPSIFPVEASVYNAETDAWDKLIDYTPTAFDVWDYVYADNDGVIHHDAYYYFGSKWERLDFGGSTFNPDHFEVVNGVVRLKEVYASLPATIGDINSILDAINGEVI